MTAHTTMGRAAHAGATPALRHPPVESSPESLRVAERLRQAQSGAADRVLADIESELRAATGDLADGAPGLHFVRVVALERLHPHTSALPAADLFLAAALREMSGWLACAYAMRAICLLDHGGSHTSGTDSEMAVHDLAAAEAALESVVTDLVQTCNAHADLGVAYEMLRLYELAEPHYRAAHDTSVQVRHPAVKPVLWSMNLTGLHLVWGLELYRVNAEPEAGAHLAVAAEYARQAQREAEADDDAVMKDMASLRILCARADADPDDELTDELERAIERARGQESHGTIAVAESCCAVALAKTGRSAHAIARLDAACRDGRGSLDPMTEAALTHTRAVLLAHDGRADAQAALAYGDVLAQMLWQERLRTLDAARTVRAFESLRERHEAVARSASTDPLTGLANRRALDELISHLAGGAESRPVGVLVIDVDKFKLINDTWGHDVGDATLRDIAAVLTASVRAGDTVVRSGGDEFIVLLPGTTSDVAAAVAARIVAAVDGIDDCVATASVGVTVASALQVREALRTADEAMYQAKRAGGARLHLATSPSSGPDR